MRRTGARICAWLTGGYVVLFLMAMELPDIPVPISADSVLLPLTAYVGLLVLIGSFGLIASVFLRSCLPTALWAVGHLGVLLVDLGWAGLRGYHMSCRELEIAYCSYDPNCRMPNPPACTDYEILAEWARLSPGLASAVALALGAALLWAAWAWNRGRWELVRVGWWLPWLTAAMVLWLLVTAEMPRLPRAGLVDLALFYVVVLLNLRFFALTGRLRLPWTGTQGVVVFLALYWSNERVAALANCQRPCGLVETAATALGIGG